MVVTELPVNLTLPPPKIPRSPGQHVSGIIRCMATEMGILKPEWAEELSLVDAREITDPTTVLRILIGLGWERQYVDLLPDVVDHPSEIEYDGVYMSPDGESLSFIYKWVKVIHEFKSTYKSTKTVGDLTSQFMWLSQIKSYCKATDTLFAELHVLFLNGDYSYPMKPMLKKWRIEFTQQEIDDNWRLLMDYLEYRRAQEAGME